MNKKTEKKSLIKKLNLDYKNIKFEVNWASGSALFFLLCACAYFYIDNKDLRKTIKDINESNSTLVKEKNDLKDRVGKLEGSNQTYDNVIKTFMDNPPGVLNQRMDDFEARLNSCCGQSYYAPKTTTAKFKNVAPPK